MKNTKNMVLAAFFLALGLIMPFITGHVPVIGNALCPMHIPVLICGYVCGWQYGMMVGFVVPLLRSVLFGMPPMMPTAIAMAFELAAYGSMTGLLYRILHKSTVGIYISLILSMLIGRIVWGIVSIFLYGINGNAFSWKIFITNGFLNAIPGIILQIVLIPVIIIALEKAGVLADNRNL